METALFLTGSLSLLVWLLLLNLNGRFWHADQQLSWSASEPNQWPDVAAVLVASDGAEAIEETLAGLLEQAYPGAFHVILVDDCGRKGTAEAALAVAQEAGVAKRLNVLSVKAPPSGWSRRAWAIAQAQELLTATVPSVGYLWLTQPWIQHGRRNLRDLVAKAEEDGCDLVSMLPMSTCQTAWDRLMAPAFAFFFQAFHPLRRVNDPQDAAAAASAGCLLVNVAAVNAAGGFTAFKDAAVLECSLAYELKAMARRNGRCIWLGLGEDSIAVRRGDGGKALRDLALITATAQRHPSLARAAANTVAMAFACLARPVVFFWTVVAGLFLDIDLFLVTFLAVLVSCAAWAAMSVAARPTFQLYYQDDWLTLLLPLAALAQALVTMALAPTILGVARRTREMPTAIERKVTPPSLRTGKARPRPVVPSLAGNKATAGHQLRQRMLRS